MKIAIIPLLRKGAELALELFIGRVPTQKEREELRARARELVKDVARSSAKGFGEGVAKELKNKNE